MCMYFCSDWKELSPKVSVPAEERSHGTVSTKTYICYFITGGG